MTTAFLVLLVALGAVFAFLAIVSWRKCADVLSEVRGIASALRSVRSKIETHDAELDAVTDALHQLRGKFYAERRKYTQASESSTDSTDATTDGGTLKDMLRRKAGITAGRPAPHS